MRIGIFTDAYTPFVNGVTTSVLMLKKGLENKGHKVYVITVNPNNMHFSETRFLQHIYPLLDRHPGIR